MGAPQSGATPDVSLMAFIGIGPVQAVIKKRMLWGAPTCAAGSYARAMNIHKPAAGPTFSGKSLCEIEEE